MKFVYLIGAPGSGKSTAAAAMRALSGKSQPHEEPIPHMVMWRGGMPWYAELGRKRASFSGTDALAMDIIGKAIEFVHTKPFRRLFAEGDRLANARFFAEVKAAGYDLQVVYLTLPREKLEERRALRTKELGKAQDPTWLKGRDSKNHTLAELFSAELIDATMTPSQVAARLRAYFA